LGLFKKKSKTSYSGGKTANEFSKKRFYISKFRYHITKRYGYRPLINTPGIHHCSIHEQNGHMICLLAFREIFTSLWFTLRCPTTITLHQAYMKKKCMNFYSFPYFV